MATPSKLRPIRRNTLTAQVVDRVRDYIFKNELRPGDRLPSEEVLARQLRVSRPTVRQALKALDVGGLITSQPRVGTTVSPFSYEQVVDVLNAHFHLSGTSLFELMEARCVIEHAALPLVVAKITPSQLETLRAIEADLEQDLRQGGLNTATLDEAFHAALLEATDNHLLRSFIGLLAGLFRHPRHVELEKRNIATDRRRLTAVHHRELIDAISRRDLAAADATLRRHFEGPLAVLAEDEASRRAAS